MLRQLGLKSGSLRGVGVLGRGFGRRQIPQLSLGCNFHTKFGLRKEEEPLPPTLIEKYELHKTERWVPLVAGGFGLATVTGLYHWDAESQMLGLFVLFVGTVYTQGGDAIKKYFDEQADAILKEHNAVEDAEIASVKTVITAHKRQTEIYDDMKNLYEAHKALLEESITARDKGFRHQARAEVVSGLESVLKAEQDSMAEIRKALIEKTTARVQDAFIKGDPSVKASALSSALQAIRDPSAQKEDMIGDLFKQHFADARKKLEALQGKEVELDAASKQAVMDKLEPLLRSMGDDGKDLKVQDKFTFRL